MTSELSSSSTKPRIFMGAYERELFLELTGRYKEAIADKRNNISAVTRKQEAWASLCRDFNSDNRVSRRTPEQLKKYWYNLKAALKKELAGKRKSVSGQPIPTPDVLPTPVETTASSEHILHACASQDSGTAAQTTDESSHVIIPKTEPVEDTDPLSSELPSCDNCLPSILSVTSASTVNHIEALRLLEEQQHERLPSDAPQESTEEQAQPDSLRRTGTKAPPRDREQALLEMERREHRLRMTILKQQLRCMKKEHLRKMQMMEEVHLKKIKILERMSEL